MNDETVAIEKPSAGRWFVPSLIVSFFAVGGSGAILRLFAVDIARTFQVPVGVVAQLGTANSVGELVVALLMGFLAVRFKHKSLLLAGVLLITVYAVGSFLAPSFILMLLFFAMEGI